MNLNWIHLPKKLCTLLLGGFCFSPSSMIASQMVVEAPYTSVVPVIDGVLEDDVWSRAPFYRLNGLVGEKGNAESAWVQFSWNTKGLYVAIRCQDRSIFQAERRDQQYHFLFGDVFEVFIKPLNDSYYWENYVTPYGNHTTLFLFKSAGGQVFSDPMDGHEFKGLQSAAKRAVDFEVSGEVFHGWTAEMWIPSAYMTAFGEPWAAGAPWSLLCGRYNYGMDLSREPELTVFPPLSRLYFHLTDEYAKLILLPADGE